MTVITLFPSFPFVNRFVQDHCGDDIKARALFPKLESAKIEKVS